MISPPPLENQKPSLVTGSTGFIGSRLVSALRKAGSPVREIRRLAHRDRSRRESSDIRFAELDDVLALTEAMQGVEVVYHLAGFGSPSSPQREEGRIIDTNITGTLNVLNAAVAAGARRVVIASSASVYGHLSSPALREDMLPQPMSPYAISKLSAEHFCSTMSHTFGLETVALRYFNVYGPGEDPDGRSPKLIPTLLRRLAAHEPITLFGDGQQTRDFVHVDDAVRATILAGTSSGVDRLVVNIGTGQPTTIGDVVKLLADNVDTESDVVYAPERPYEIRHSVADIGKAREALGFRPAVTIDDAIPIAVNAIQNMGWMRRAG